MNAANADRIADTLPPSALVLDVGGGASAFPRADYVADAISYDQRNALGAIEAGGTTRYSRETWVQVDVCGRKPWPFADKSFDYVVCSHLLEDVRDPIWICHELQRVAKAGYIEVPSRVLEQSLGVEHPRYAGYYHHRWLIQARGNRLEFRHKPHLLHSLRDAIVAEVGIRTAVNPKHSIVVLEWDGDFEFEEVLEFDEARVADELCEFARAARALPELLVPIPSSPIQTVKRTLYYRRLAAGRR